MKMIYGGTPVNSMKVKHYEISTSDATTVPSAVQAGLTYYANGQKQTGTGKSFEFASYGNLPTNRSVYVPSNVNIIQISSMDNAVQLTIALNDIKNKDFSVSTEVAKVLVDDVLYPIFVEVNGHFLSVNCEQTLTLQVFYGKDNYI